MWAENKAGGRSLKTYTEKVQKQKYIIWPNNPYIYIRWLPILREKRGPCLANPPPLPPCLISDRAAFRAMSLMPAVSTGEKKLLWIENNDNWENMESIFILKRVSLNSLAWNNFHRWINFQVLWPSPRCKGFIEWPDDLCSLGHRDVSLPCWRTWPHSLLCG